MKTDQTRRSILELCSESEHGSWEFWLDESNKTQAECTLIIQTIISLVKEKKIFAMEHETVIDQSYQEVPLEVSRLEEEVSSSRKMDNVKPDKFYWFLATDDGKKEDIALRKDE